jgi:Holliday junction resolvase RusA-like endonuclease
MIIRFTVFGSPVAQPRTKAQAVVSKTGRMFAHTYEPGKKDSPARQWKSDIKQVAVLYKPPTPYRGPVGLEATFFFPRPARLCRKRDPAGPLPHVCKPDRDNCEKAVLDALKGILFVDDCQVYQGEVRKFYHAKDDGPRVDIAVWWEV